MGSTRATASTSKAAGIVRLAAAVNTAADRFEELHRSVEERIAEARTRIEEEKNILSVVLAELPEGVVICTPEGRITLYNQRARQLLESSGEPPLGGRPATRRASSVWVAPFSASIDKPIITCALDDIADAAQGRPRSAARPS